MTKQGKIAVWVLAAVLALVIMWMCGVFGVPAFGIEKDARKTGHIDSSWQVAQSTTGNMSALLYYNEDLSNYDVQIYLKNKGLSTGYRFIASGQMMYDQNVGTYYNEGNEDCAYFSLNQCEISCMEIDHGQSVESIQIDCHVPFAIVLPANTGTVRFYDKKGEIVEEISGYGASSVW